MFHNEQKEAEQSLETLGQKKTTNKQILRPRLHPNCHYTNRNLVVISSSIGAFVCFQPQSDTKLPRWKKKNKKKSMFRFNSETNPTPTLITQHSKTSRVSVSVQRPGLEPRLRGPFPWSLTSRFLLLLLLPRSDSRLGKQIANSRASARCGELPAASTAGPLL